MNVETERLLLRAVEPDDAEAIERQIGRHEVARMLLRVPYPYPEGAAAEWIASATPGETFAITRADDGELLGVIGIHPDEEPGHAEIGYWLGAEHWNRGYMTEAVGAIVDYGFRELGLSRIHAGVFPHNAASIRVLEKVGMRPEGTLSREPSVQLGELVDVLRYRILRSEWRG